MLALVTGLLALFGATSALPHAKNEVAARAGPSGYVVYPPGGTTFYNDGGYAPNDGAGGTGFVHIQYQGLTWSSGVATIGVDVYLEDPTGKKPDAYLAYDFGNPVPEDNVLIDGYFSPPTGYCGDFNLVFVEHQNEGNFGTIIKFRAAAPAITIVCDPIQ